MNIAIILSGGVGSRMGLNIPKQYSMVCGHPIIYYCLKTFIEDSIIDELVIVVAKEWKAFVQTELEHLHCKKPVYYASPGETRQFSIYNALNVIEDNAGQETDIVIIHDGARPLISQELINMCIEKCSNADGVMPCIPVKDTTYLSDDGVHIQQLLNRSHLWSGQAPEAFRFGKYISAHKSMSNDEISKINGSTEMAFKNGLQCKMIAGDPMNFKITTPEDLSNFESILKQSAKNNP